MFYFIIYTSFNTLEQQSSFLSPPLLLLLPPPLLPPPLLPLLLPLPHVSYPRISFSGQVFQPLKQQLPL